MRSLCRREWGVKRLEAPAAGAATRDTQSGARGCEGSSITRPGSAGPTLARFAAAGAT
jgi:hypothetical protein